MSIAQALVKSDAPTTRCRHRVCSGPPIGLAYGFRIAHYGSRKAEKRFWSKEADPEAESRLGLPLGAALLPLRLKSRCVIRSGLVGRLSFRFGTECGVATQPGVARRASFRFEAEPASRPPAANQFQINTGATSTPVRRVRRSSIRRTSSATGRSPKRATVRSRRGARQHVAWAREDMAEFWGASEAHERANGNTYREYELALPRELSPAARLALVEPFAAQAFGVTRPYQWAIHTCTARNGKEQPHVHLMSSHRQLDPMCQVTQWQQLRCSWIGGQATVP